MMDEQGDKPDETAALRAKADRFGPAYAAMSEVLGGRGLDRAVAVMKLVIAAFAAFVVLGAIWASL